MKDYQMPSEYEEVPNVTVPSCPVPVDKIPGGWYWPLFKHMSDAHGLTLLDSEMEEIRLVVLKMESTHEETRENTKTTQEAV